MERAAMMDIDWLRKTCRAFPHVTEQIQWGYDLVFKVGGRMFAVAPTELARVCLSFKCCDETFAELTERPGIIPAPYMARAKWVALETHQAISRPELAELLKTSYALVIAKLPKRMQTQLAKKPEKGKRTNKKRAENKSTRRKSKLKR
jgi:predicted DNA-binding protein (MmcQ/YjbR family)